MASNRFLFAGALALVAALPLHADEIQWFTTYKEGMEAAKAANKPVLIDFYADWCGPCRMLDQQVFPDENVISVSKDYVAIKVNVDQEDDIALAYHVRSIPRTVILNVHGEIVGDQIGFMGADEYAAFLSAAKDYAFQKVDGIKVTLPENPGAPEFQVDAATAEDALWEFMAHADPALREKAREQLVQRGNETIDRFLAHATTAQYLGMRLAAYEVIAQIGRKDLENFDPWQTPAHE